MPEILPFRPATELAAEVRAGRIGARDLLELHIARIDRYDGDLNAIVVRDLDRARAEAGELDRRAAAGDFAGRLHGVPITVKESFNVAGLPTTWGVPGLRAQVAGRDAVVVERLRAAGAVIIGKTNVPFMLMDYQADNEIHGRTSNPWDLGRSPGGSSGGAAAALAAGLSALEFGSDIGGSIRRPANHCGVYGLKPTWNVIPGRGHSPSGGDLGWSPADLAVVGPMARSAGDLELALDLTAGPDRLEVDGWHLALPPAVQTSLSDFRVAYMADHAIAPIDGAVRGSIDTAVAKLEAAGLAVDREARPEIDWPEMNQTFAHLLFSVFTADMPMAEIEAAKAALEAGQVDEQSGEALIARTGLGLHRDWLALNRKRALLRERWAAFFEDFDLLLCPISSTAAFPHEANPDFGARTLLVNGTEQPFFQQSFWSGIATLPYLPVVTAPSGPTADGLPVGVQIIAPAYHDRRAIRFAELMAAEIGGFVPPPGYE